MRFRSLLSSALILAFCVSAFAQDLQVYDNGRLEDVKGMRRVHVGPRRVGGNSDIDAIESRIRGRNGLRLVREGSVADFLLHYEYSDRENAAKNLPDTGAKARLQAYRVRGNVIVIVWDKEETTSASRNAAATSLVEEFLKDFGEMNGKK